MTNPFAPPSAHTVIRATLEGEEFSLSFEATVPAGATTVGEMLPLARALADTIVGEAVRLVQEAGESISCTSGCGACCRSLVAISQPEARDLHDLVAALPEARRAVVQQRFRLARRRLEAAGLLDQMRDFDSWTDADYQSMVGAYFALGIACPFLEQESCSIYARRPITCREFLVTSPPRLCARQDSGGMKQVRLPLRLFNAVARWQVPAQGEFMERWVPLILALDWAAAHPDDAPPRPGPALLEELVRCINR